MKIIIQFIDEEDQVFERTEASNVLDAEGNLATMARHWIKHETESPVEDGKYTNLNPADDMFKQGEEA